MEYFDLELKRVPRKLSGSGKSAYQADTKTGSICPEHRFEIWPVRFKMEGELES